VRQLRATLDDLRQAAAREKLEQLRKAKAASPPETTEPKDRVVDIRNRREARRAGRTDS
jgi:IS5 family transposase